jgi:hypothetical protein
MALNHKYSRKCWCDACFMDHKRHLATFAVWYFSILFVLMVAGIVTIPILAYYGVLPR